MNSQQDSYPNQGPEPEYDAQGNPTPEWEAAYAEWLTEVWGDDTGDGLDDEDAEVDAAAGAPAGTFYDQEAPGLPRSGV